MRLDTIIIADSETESVSESSPMRFTIDGRTATIQAVYDYLSGVVPTPEPATGDRSLSWAAAPKLNGIALLSDLLQHGYRAGLVNDFAKDRAKFMALLAQKPRSIVISTTFMVGKAGLHKLVEKIRALAPGIPIIAGGPFVTQSYRVWQRREEALFSGSDISSHYLFWDAGEPDIDLYVTTQHSPELLRTIIDHIREDLPLESFPGTAWRDRHGAFQFGPETEKPAGRIRTRIDWSGLPDDVFASRVIPLQASSGCPYRCRFCNFVHDQHTTYAKKAEEIVAEMAAVAERGVKYVWFVDDIFQLGKGNLNETCKAIIDADLDLKWMTFIRADTVHDIDFDLLKAAGCHELQFGLESADPRVLSAMNKRANPDIYRRSIKQAMTVGINISAYFLFGFPGETEETIARTIAFIQEIQYPDLPGSLSWSIYPFILVPLSPIYEAEQRQRYGLDGFMMNWEHDTMATGTARAAIRKAIMALEDSAPIYREDNLAMLEELDPDTRKAFFKARLRLAKLASLGQAEPETIRQTFSEIFNQPLLKAKWVQNS